MHYCKKGVDRADGGVFPRPTPCTSLRFQECKLFLIVQSITDKRRSLGVVPEKCATSPFRIAVQEKDFGGKGKLYVPSTTIEMMSENSGASKGRASIP